jgi:hypothetical protein
MHAPVRDANVSSPIVMSRRLQVESPTTTLFCPLARDRFRQA